MKTSNVIKCWIVSLAIAGATTCSALGEYVAAHPLAYVGGASVRDGECVSLVKQATGAPLTTRWIRGVRVKGAKLASGTAIATFGPNGRYAGHAALYLGQNAEGIRVVDQSGRRPAVRNAKGKLIQAARSAQPPAIRIIKWASRGGHGEVDNGDLYFVVK